VATIGGDDADALATVVGAAAAERDDQVAPVGLICFEPFMHIFVGGVGMCAVIDDRVHAAGGFDDLGDLRGDAGVGNAFVGAYKGFLATEGIDLVADFLV